MASLFAVTCRAVAGATIAAATVSADPYAFINHVYADGSQPESSSTSTGGFDPEALERGAKVLREINRSQYSKQVFEIMRKQEETRLEELAVEKAQFEAGRSQEEIEKQRKMAEEQLNLVQQQAQAKAQMARYEDELARKRMQTENDSKRRQNVELVRMQEESSVRKEKARRATEEQIHAHQRQTEKEKAEIERETIRVKAMAEAEGRAHEAKLTEDQNKRMLIDKMNGEKEKWLAAINTTFSHVEGGLRMLLTDRSRLGMAVGGVTAIAAGVYTTREGARVMWGYINRILGQPSLIRESSIGKFPWSGITSRLKNKSSILGAHSLHKSSSDGRAGFGNVILHPSLQRRIMMLARATANTKSHQAPFRNMLFYGPPGTGKTMVAKEISRKSGLDYAMMTGGDVAPLGSQAVTKIHQIFDWAKKSKKGLLLFIDEADAFLCERNSIHMSEAQRSALNALLFRTGDQSRDIVLVLATNRPGDLDAAITDRIDEVLEFPLPGVEERHELLKLYLNKYISRKDDKQSSKWKSFFRKDQQAITVKEDMSEDIFREAAQKCDGFSGREIAKLMASVQASVYGRHDCVLDAHLFQEIVEYKVAEHHQRIKLATEAVVTLCVASLLVKVQWSSCSEVVSVGCSSKERDALIKFKSKIEDPNEFYAWKGNECCKWKGILCTNSTHTGVRVIKLDLSYMRFFSGEFDASLLYLKYLQHLDLSGINFIQSSVQMRKSNLILDLISEFHDLRYLSLSNAFLVGIVPLKMQSLRRIQHLDLSGNRGLSLENGGLFSNLSSLKYLDMSGVSLRNTSGWLESLNALSSISVIRLSNCDIGSISDSILPHVNFTSLVKLDLSNNPMIDSAFPDWMFRLPNIEDLNLEAVIWSPNSNAIGFPLGIQNLSKLRSFDFSENHLGGSIPESLGEFSVHLREINLSNNMFNGSIPKSIGDLSNLEVINFSDNRMIGSIPKSIGQLSLLKIVDFSSNKLSHSIPRSIFEISSLQNLNLRNNNLSGKIPTSIGTPLSSLQQLNLETNTLVGFIPISIGKLKYLIELDLGHNQLLGSIPESLCNLSKLEFLHLSNNDNMNGTIPSCLFQNPLLEVLDLGGKGLKGVVLESDLQILSNLQDLRLTGSKSLILNVSKNWIPPFSLSYLYLSFCEIGSEFPSWIQTQKDIEILSITNTGMLSTLPKWIWDFSSSITYIQLSSNGLIGSLPDFAYLEYYGFLSDFDINLRNNKFEGTIPTSLCKMNLTSLDLSRNHFTGEVPGCLMGINGILNLARNNLQATIPSSNNSVCNLQALNLENNNISGTLPTSLKLCNDIVILDLGKIPLLLSNLSSLQLLDLSQNHLSGRIPKSFADFKAMSQKHMIDEEMTHSNFEIGDSSGMAEQGDIYTDDISITFKGSVITYTKLLPLFTSIDLSMNELDGEVPRELGKLTFLVNLNLSRNRLTAKIPDTMSALKDLQALDLSQNNLSGQIPKTMRRMTSLSDLNLSFNNLSGSIPSGFQFQTFVDPLVYANNPYLCGFPLEKSCDHEQTPRLVSDKKPIDSNIIGIYISLILGFILGLWSFYGTLCLKKTWRYSYFKFLNEIDEIIYSWYIHN